MNKLALKEAKHMDDGRKLCSIYSLVAVDG